MGFLNLFCSELVDGCKESEDLFGLWIAWRYKIVILLRHRDVEEELYEKGVERRRDTSSDFGGRVAFSLLFERTLFSAFLSRLLHRLSLMQWISLGVQECLR